MTERIIVSDAALGELEASRTFEAFYQAEARTLFRRLWLVTGNRAEAEELMQDAFLSVWERWDRVGGMDDPIGYLYRTAMNLFRKRYRRAIGISFFTADGVYSDPCHWDVQGTGRADVGDVEVGPTVDDLVAALRANTFYTSSEPAPVTIDGYTGQELELQLPDDPFTSCDKEPGDSVGHAFVFSGPGLYAQGPANRWHLYILDVEGTRLIAVILSYAQTPQSDLDLSRNIIETLDIAP